MRRKGGGKCCKSVSLGWKSAVVRKQMDHTAQSKRMNTHLVEEIAPALRRAAKTLLGHITFVSVYLLGLLIGDDGAIILVLVVECKLYTRRYLLQREEGEVIEVRIRVIVGDREEAAVRVAGMVHKPRGATHVHPVTDIFVGNVVWILPELFAVFGITVFDFGVGFSRLNLPIIILNLFREFVAKLALRNQFGVAELIEVKKVVGFVRGSFRAAPIGFCNGNNLASVGINKVTLS